MGDRKVAVRIILVLQDPIGAKLEREFLVGELQPEHMDEQPAWMKNPKRRPGLREPTLLTGTVRRGHEAEARAWLQLPDPSPTTPTSR